MKAGTNEMSASSVESKFKKNFWQTCKDTFNKATNSLPMFNLQSGENYFKKILSDNGSKTFEIPDWIPKLPTPNHTYNDSEPTYEEVATAIGKCKNGASACPFDQLSILILKRCPILRTALHRIIVECWKQRRVPECWKIGATILIYKKGDTEDPANFRPITLQPVWYKVFASVWKKGCTSLFQKTDM